jgi:hypothetical protein
MFLTFGDALVGALVGFGDFIIVSYMHNKYLKFNIRFNHKLVFWDGQGVGFYLG